MLTIVPAAVLRGNDCPSMQFDAGVGIAGQAPPDVYKVPLGSEKLALLNALNTSNRNCNRSPSLPMGAIWPSF